MWLMLFLIFDASKVTQAKKHTWLMSRPGALAVQAGLLCFMLMFGASLVVAAGGREGGGGTAAHESELSHSNLMRVACF